jgi:arginyl-tRNA synthetase
MFFWQNLKKIVVDKLDQKDLVFSYPPSSKMGDLSLTCFEVAKRNHKDPVKLASLWAKKINQDKSLLKYFSEVKSTGPYVNFFLSLQILADRIILEIKAEKDKYGQNSQGQGAKVMVEYSNGNTHKEYHVGHLRNIAYGDAVSNILEANGFNSIRVSYINDFGIHTAKTIWNWKNNPEYLNRPEPKGFLLGRCYAEASERINDRPEYKLEVAKIMHDIESRQGENYNLWKETRSWSIDYFSSIYKELGVKFEKIFYESELIDEGLSMVESLLKKGILKKSDGAVIADLEKYDLGILPVIRSDKTALYSVADLALAVNKFSLYNLSESIYVVDVRQSLYFKQLFKVLKLLGYKQKLVHLPYEFVTLPEGMMSSRNGNVITYCDLKEKIKNKLEKETKVRREDWTNVEIEKTVEALTIAVIKFEMLKVGADKTIVFNLEEALKFDGYTACYLEYSYARLKSILRKEGSTYFSGKANLSFLQESKEKELLIELAKYPEVVALAGEKKNPSEIAKYLFELAQISNNYYHAVNVLKADKKVKKARLLLIKAVTQTLKNGFDMLGLPVLEEM